MKLHKTWAVMAVCALVLTGCRGSDDGGGGGDGDVSAPGVSSEPCPDAVNKDNGCIYLGQISDLTVGPFATLAVPITDAQKAFWKRVNDDGGIDGYDIDVSKYVRDNLYLPETHAQVYEEIKGDVLGLAQSLGSPTTLAILEDLNANDVVTAPASWTSLWEFEDVILESGTNYCFEAMNIVDYIAEKNSAKSVMMVYYPGDYGGDGAAGAEIAAEANGMTFTGVETASGPEAQAGAVSAVVRAKPDLVVLATGPTDAAVIVGESAGQGYQGQFVGLGPVWNPALLASPAAPAFESMFLASGYWGAWGTDTPGHQAMRDALPDVEPNDGYTAGWVWSYAMKAALEEWLAGDYDKSRAGLLEAVKSLETVDYEGMLPAEAGKFGGEPNDTVFRESVISKVDPAAPTGLTVIEDFSAGPTASEYEFTESCFGG